MATILYKVGGFQDGNNAGGEIKFRANGRQTDKLEQDIDFTTFLNRKNYGSFML